MGEGLQPRGASLRSMARSARLHVIRLVPACPLAETHGRQSSRPNRSRGTRGQVTTATPAGLDFRAARAAGEGFVDTMSTGSHASMRCLESVERASIRMPPEIAVPGGRLCDSLEKTPPDTDGHVEPVVIPNLAGTVARSTPKKYPHHLAVMGVTIMQPGFRHRCGCCRPHPCRDPAA